MSKGFVKVPQNIVRNEGFKLTSGDFSLYVRLCYLFFKNYNNPEMRIDHKKLMAKVGIADTRTLKKRFKSLYENKLMLNEINKLPRRGEVDILLNEEVVNECKYFTMMNLSVFNYVDEINEHAFRLLFYYKSYINRNPTEYDGEEKVRDYCFVGVERIKYDLKMGSDTVKDANDMLVDKKLIKITRHAIKHDYEYDEDDELIYDRYNNHYHLHKSLFQV